MKGMNIKKTGEGPSPPQKPGFKGSGPPISSSIFSIHFFAVILIKFCSHKFQNILRQNNIFKKIVNIFFIKFFQSELFLNTFSNMVHLFDFWPLVGCMSFPNINLT